MLSRECTQCHSQTDHNALPYEEEAWEPPVRLVGNPPEQASQEVNSKRAIPPGMALIPEGVFIMGYDKRLPDEGPMHQVHLPSYTIDLHEVTNAQYKEFSDATGHPPPKHWRFGIIPPGKADHPVVYVTWFDAHDYCAWVGKRLPSEAEWEKAARGTDGRIFPWGNTFDVKKANTPMSRIGDTTPVGSFPEGRSPYGLSDMAGNVWEWTTNWYRPYPANRRETENYGEKYKVSRGGSWVNCAFYRCGVSAPTFNRGFFLPLTKNKGFGFRCAAST